jgi:hypothetical protein
MRFVPVKSIQHRIFNRFTASFVLEPLSLSILCRWRKATNRAMLWRLMCYAEKCAGSRGISRQRLRLELGTTLCQLTRELGCVRWNWMMQDDGEFAN